jgi:Kef-type K+ transport system membrane component KefB
VIALTMPPHGAPFSGFVQMAVILVVAGVASAIARRLGQAGVVGIMIAGLALGASGLGAVAPAFFHRVFDAPALAQMETLSQLGVVLLVFGVGLTTNFSHVVHRDGRRVVIALTAAGIPVAFAIGTTFGLLTSHVLAPRIPVLPFALFIGTALSITALPILGRILAELGIARSRLASIGIAAAGSTDAIGWLLLSVVGAIASATLAPGSLLLKTALLVAFLLAARYVVRPLFARYLDVVHASSSAVPASAIAGGLTLLFLFAVTTSAIGVFPAFGAFVAGAIAYDRQRFVALWSTGVEPFVQAFFVPVYFCFTGLRTDIGALSTLADWAWCAALLAVATLAKFGTTSLIAGSTGLPPRAALAIGAMMNTKGLVELVAINLGYEMGVIPRSVYTMLVLVAVVSTAATAPLLRRLLPAGAGTTMKTTRFEESESDRAVTIAEEVPTLR